MKKPKLDLLIKDTESSRALIDQVYLLDSVTYSHPSFNRSGLLLDSVTYSHPNGDNHSSSIHIRKYGRKNILILIDKLKEVCLNYLIYHFRNLTSKPPEKIVRNKYQSRLS